MKATLAAQCQSSSQFIHRILLFWAAVACFTTVTKANDVPYTQLEALKNLLLDGNSTQFITSAIDDASRRPIRNVKNGKKMTFTVNPIYYEGAEYEGNLTRIFAWVGLPDNANKLDPASIPAVVLVHGGGGTAFHRWVIRWNRRGYAAIAMALEGQTDVRQPEEVAMEEKFNYNRHMHSPGPARARIPYSDWEKPIEDQWMYQSVANVMKAHNLLRSYDYIDPDKIGVVGVSWGGVITSTVIGVDQRFGFAVSIYGCGDMHNADNSFGRGVRLSPDYPTVWDPVIGLRETTVPMLWISFPQEHTFMMANWQASVDATASPNMQVLSFDMGHGHAAGWARPESYSFAFWATHDGKKKMWSKQTREEVTATTYKAYFRSSKPFAYAELVYAKDELTTLSKDRNWQRKRAFLHGNAATKKWVGSVELPPGTKSWFLNFHTIDHDLTVTSTYHEQDLEAGME